MKFVAVTAALAIGMLAGVTAANAAPAFANVGTDVRLGPTFDSPVTGFMPQNATLDANCNPQGWCEVVGTGRTATFAGWVEASTITLADAGMAPGNQRPPAPQPNPGGGNNGGPGFSFDFNFGTPVPPPRPQPLPVYEEAEACFYTERNFRGASFCLAEGDEFPRLPRDWDDRIRSVEVFGGATVDLCSDTNFYGSCVTVDGNVSRLPSGIDRRVSSIEVYY